ncbi:major intrinsic protein-domain-containing protein [Aspergillus pseudotamarii]|uniref:Major intrinsic protein-domain-containing protein n=1 Tax=Aspergillus pseudotamarii TaxID=132259 RepID=A0A5N6SVH8_ASPPS|nr:major intrinsic protein-domain-containing protein [Aspergillus pseudotamarii]KAE8137839.1 major intrinsic protein-domain-containing protein [Aspergillus pseudotamarii]
MDRTAFPDSGNMPQPRPIIQPFAGRIGGNQGLVVDRTDPDNADILKKVPDAAPLMTFREGFDLRGFWDIDLWKFGFIECMGTMMMVFVTSWMAVRPASTSANVSATSPSGIFSTSTFLGPLFGGISNWLFLTLFIFSFSNVSGSHLNPTITLATFFARLISLPRMVIYLLGQTLGGALAGFMLQRAYGSKDFTVGGCTVNTRLVPVDEAFLLEFIFCLVLIFLSFGVGLDPRQGSIYGAALSPFLVGMTLGVVSWGSSFTRAGYAGACEKYVTQGVLTHCLHDSVKSGSMLRRLCSYQLSGIPLDSLGRSSRRFHRARYCLLYRSSLGALTVA